MTTSATRVFLARIAGVRVFDPSGEQLGKVRDSIIVLRTGAPRLTGLVVEVQAHRRIFVPMSKVTSIDSSQIIVTGVVNLRRFEKRPNETLLTAELLDRTVDLIETGEVVSVIDVGVELDRTQDWIVTQLFVQKGSSGFRRRGERIVVDWEEVRGLSMASTTDQSASTMLASIDNLRAADIAALLHELPAKRRMEIARQLNDDRLADVLEELPEDDRVEIVQLLEVERAADVIEEMDPDDAADLISELPTDRAADLLERMEPEEADDIRRLLSYDEFSAGGMMTTEPVVLSPDATVADALAQIRNPDLSPALASQVYVTRSPTETPTGKYLGTCHFQRLLREPPATLVSALVDSDLVPVHPEAPLSQITRTFATYNLAALPVVDLNGHLLGAVTVDDLIDHMLPDDWRENDGDDRG
ncbi:MAG: CBS domain-containing protein [Candidatus Nanopelagicales bacterium]|nr:CBS domain-containing protein [Candidatus Nanopelagicales bacterium]